MCGVCTNNMYKEATDEEGEEGNQTWHDILHPTEPPASCDQTNASNSSHVHVYTCIYVCMKCACIRKCTCTCTQVAVHLK